KRVSDSFPLLSWLKPSPSLPQIVKTSSRLPPVRFRKSIGGGRRHRNRPDTMLVGNASFLARQAWLPFPTVESQPVFFPHSCSPATNPPNSVRAQTIPEQTLPHAYRR